MPERRPSVRWLLPLAAVALPVVVGAALIPLRDTVENTNVALILVVVVVSVAALGRRGAALLTAVAASATFNLLHTEPYYSFPIDSSDDVETTVLLLIVGLVVAEVAVRARRARSEVQRRRYDLSALRGLGAMVAQGDDADRILRATERELSQLLGLDHCRFEGFADDGPILPSIERT